MSQAVSRSAGIQYHNITTLTREQAKAKLHTLALGSEERRQLEGVLLKASGIAEIALPDDRTYKVNTCCQHLLGGFGSSEHMAIGEGVNLPGLPKNAPLLVKGPVELKFQDIVALAGDFYGVYKGAISLGGPEANRTQRFEAVFNTLDAGDSNQLRKLMLEIEDESRKVNESGLPHHCYSSQLMEKGQRMKAIKEDIDDLLVDNSDHFSSNAIIAYEIGHARALEEARIAGREKNPERYKRALAMDAAACHYLTDLFASGHVRNKRGELETHLRDKFGIDPEAAKVLAGILTGAQHQKEGNEGLNVENGKGEQWRAYGDGNFFTAKNEKNKEHAIAAVQQSVNEIDHAYRNPEAQTPSTVKAEHIPKATDYNPPALYSFDNQELFIHQDGKRIPIKTAVDFYTKGIALALLYLPEDYVNRTIDSAIKGTVKRKIYELFGLDISKQFATVSEIFSPVTKGLEIANRVLMPRVEEFTSSIWHVIGLATYHQVKKESRELNEKVTEMAETVQATYQNTVKILQQLTKMATQLNLLAWDNTSRSLQLAVEEVDKMAHQHKHFLDSLNHHQETESERKLWDAYLAISKIFAKGTADGQNIIVAYQKMLAQDKTLSPEEIKTLATQWFRQMLDCQVQAISLYSDFVVRRAGGFQELSSKLPGFQSNLLEQFVVNRALIDEKLLFKSRSHITHALAKHRLAGVAVKQLESNK